MASRALAAWRHLTLLALLLPRLSLEGAAARQCFWPGQAPEDAGCLSWRVMVEANNARGWRTVPAPCVGYVKGYMTRGQYLRDLAGVMEQASGYADQIAGAGAGADDDGLDAWVFDIDDTCLSNLPYYETKQFGAYDPLAFKAWASREACRGIPPVLGLFTALLEKGFKVFLLSGRDEETLGPCTAGNLEAEGFSGYERLIMRCEHAAIPLSECVSFVTRCSSASRDVDTAEHSDSLPNRKRLDGSCFCEQASHDHDLYPQIAVKNVIRTIIYQIALTNNSVLLTCHGLLLVSACRTPEYRGQSSSVFKSAMRKQLVDEGYRIRGNVGDQWSDLQGDCVGDRVFKIPNPMYFVP
ncbi:unnamed protein product [Urochloa decumbens]|uniref:Acid phosphatase 1 n=1 Tax=Urochloa decumbens TaxID=240449 RepID=A0ABC8XU60_9POAL